MSSNKNGHVLRGTEIPRSPMPGAAAGQESESNRENENYEGEFVEVSDGESTPTFKEPQSRIPAEQAPGEGGHSFESLAKMLGSVIDQTKRIEGKFDNLESNIRRNTEKIADLDKRMVRNERNLATRVDGILDSRLGKVSERLAALEAQPIRTGKKGREEESYWLARRSLRVSPIEGLDLHTGVVRFVEEVLEADPRAIKELPPSAIRRVPTNRNAKVQNEVVVTFSTIQDRDYYRSLAYKLAGKKGRSIRLEIPNPMMGQHQVLNSLGQNLRTGNQGTRTNVRFDDEELRLVLDYKVQGSDVWKRVLPE
jgi:hypothetical protein